MKMNMFSTISLAALTAIVCAMHPLTGCAQTVTYDQTIDKIKWFEDMRTYDPAIVPDLFTDIIQGMIDNPYYVPTFKRRLLRNVSVAKIVRQCRAVSVPNGTFLGLMYNTKKSFPSFITDATLKSTVTRHGILVRSTVGKNWNKPTITKSQLRVLENYTPLISVELAKIIAAPYCNDSDGTPASWASQSLWQVYSDANLVEFAKRSVVLKLLAAEGLITLPQSTLAEFRWGGAPSVIIPLASIQWTSKDVPELQRLLSNGHYSDMARRQLTSMGR